jgi:hypothetical protein
MLVVVFSSTVSRGHAETALRKNDPTFDSSQKAEDYLLQISELWNSQIATQTCITIEKYTDYKII